eukprot:3464159-Lingulodinium_polyedra.AAC.1
MVELRAVDGDGGQLDIHDDADRARILAVLEQDGIVECVVRDPGHSAWRVSKDGLARLIMCRHCIRGRRLCEFQPDSSLHDYTTFELLLTLEAEGWEHKEVDKHARRPKPYHPGDNKVWFTRFGASTCSRYYLLALATASDRPGKD